jgi:hypothetical protein
MNYLVYLNLELKGGQNREKVYFFFAGIEKTDYFRYQFNMENSLEIILGLKNIGME